MSKSLQVLLEFAIQTAREAGQITLKYFQSDFVPEFKADESPVTIADRLAEEHIRARIEASFPTHAILGEEYGELKGNSSYKWLIDPIDGTRAFVRGVPLYAVLLGLEIDGVSRVGVAYYPALDEMLAAASGLGCKWNGQLAVVSTENRLDRALVVHTNTTSFAQQGKGKRWERLQAATGYRAGWGDAYGYLLVATGRAEIMLDPIMNPWDCGPFPVILAEAGGYFGDWHGNITSYGGEAAATNAALKQQVLELLARE